MMTSASELSYQAIIDSVKNGKRDKTMDDSTLLNNLSNAFIKYTPSFTGNQIELEMLIKPINYNNYNNYNKKFTANNIRDITKYILKAGYNKSNPNTFLRISSNTKYDNEDISSALKYMRVCIHGEEVIRGFCDDNNSIYTGKNKNVVYEKKFPKTSKEPLNLNNYDNVQLNLKEEQNHTASVNKGLVNSYGNANQFASNISVWKESNKTFRYISRVSFEYNKKKDGDINLDRSCARVDISTVYQSNGIKTWTGVNKTVKPIFEVEIEAIKINGATADNIRNSLLFALKHVLSGVQDSCFPMTTIKINEIREKYVELSEKLKYPNQLKWFSGPQPVTLQSVDVEKVCSKVEKKDKKDKKDKKNKEYTYNITNKADGTRKLLYILGKSCYFIDKKKQIQKADLEFNEQNDTDDNSDSAEYLLDGELVQTTGENSQYHVFDIYCCKSESTLDRTFKVREDLFKDVVLNLKSRNNTLTTHCKTFKDVSPQGISEIMGICKYSTFANDGMILTPNGSVSGKGTADSGADNKVYKWKSEEQTTIDFKIKVLGKAPNLNTDNGTGMGASQSKVSCELQVSMKDKPIENPCNMIYEKTMQEIKKDNVTDNKYNEPSRFEVYGDEGEIIVNGLTTFDLLENSESEMGAENNIPFSDGDIVECGYNKDYGKWIAMKVRSDKEFPNTYETAISNFDFLMNPVEISKDLCNSKIDDTPQNIDERNKNIYYTATYTRVESQRKNFHNEIKKKLIGDIAKIIRKNSSGDNISLIDYGVGEGGDLPKWKDAKIKFVYGIDYSENNLYNNRKGACARYIRMLLNKKNDAVKLQCMFVPGDCSKSIMNGEAFKNYGKEIYSNGMNLPTLINNAIFGKVDSISKSLQGVQSVQNKGKNLFDMGSCQFAMHYFFKDKQTVLQFIENLKSTIKIGGYFIGTCYNGQRVLDKLLELEYYHYKTDKVSIKLEEGDETEKENIKEKFKTDIGGLKIVVTDTGFSNQEEYLVNFVLFDQMMEKNGFKKETDYTKAFSGIGGINSISDDGERNISELNDQFVYLRQSDTSSTESPFEMVPVTEKDSKKRDITSISPSGPEEEQEEQEE